MNMDNVTFTPEMPVSEPFPGDVAPAGPMPDGGMPPEPMQ